MQKEEYGNNVTTISAYDDIFGLGAGVESFTVETEAGRKYIPIIMWKDRDINTCAYCRVSSDKKDQINSFEAQKLFFEQAFERRDNWRIKTIFADQGISGTSLKNRNEFNRMIADAKKGKYELILVKSVSRFSRNIQDLLNIVEDLRKINVYVWFMTENICTDSPDFRAQLIKEGEAAESESRKTSTRVRWGQSFAMRQGVVFGRLEMYGYNIKRDESNKQYFEVIPEEAEIIRRIYRMYADGLGTFKIAKKLESEGIKTKRYKNGWSNTVILRILRNERYVGDLITGKTYTLDCLTHQKKYNRGEYDKVKIKDHHPESAIISRELWDIVQKRLKENEPSDEVKQKHSNRFWCSGKVYCGECNQRYVSCSKNMKGGSIHKVWKCWENQQHGRKKDLIINGEVVVDENTGEVLQSGCNNRGVNDRVLRQGIHDIIEIIVRPMMQDNYEQIKCTLLNRQRESTEKESVEHFEIELKKLEDKYALLTRSFLDGKITEIAYGVTSKNIEADMQRINDEIARINAAQMDENSISADLVYRLEKLKEIIDLKDDAVSEDLYRAVVEKIEVCKDHILKYYILGWDKPIVMKYETKGRMKTYTVLFEILDS